MKRVLFGASMSVALAGLATAQFTSPQGQLHKDPATKAPVTKSVTPPGVARAGAAGGSFFGGGDDCTAPDVVVGTGTFSFDNTAATTGIDGQSEVLCDAFGTTGIDNDVWFEWTATADGLAVMQTCGTAFDTKIAAYPAGGCPVSGTAIACNDDACGLQSEITWNVTTGTTYLLQVGNFPGAFGGLGTFSLNVFGPVSNDDCTSPDIIAGQGNFPFNNLPATTGVEGQFELSCDFFGSTTVDNDVWYEWTADATGLAVVSTCGLTSVDTKMAAYDGSGCPADGSAIGCNDDACGFQSTLTFPCVSGSVYTLQVGTFPGASGGVGTFDIDIFPPVLNDDCSSPTMIAGQGVFPYSNIGATTGLEGQIEPLCDAFGSTSVDNDVWFEWTADADGLALISTCFQTTTDSKLAAYPSGGCPIDGTALACNDDACGLQSTIAFNVTSGETYLLQAGNFPGAAGGPSALDISIVDLPDGYVYDLGSSDNSLGLTAGGGVAWMHGFEAEGGSDTISEVSSTFGTPVFPGLPPGLTGSVAIWDDPTNDFDPNDATLLYSAPITAANEDTDIFNAYSIPNVPVSGVFFVGILLDNPGGTFPAPLDSSFPSGGRAWIVGNTTGNGGLGSFDLNNLAFNDVPPADLDSIGFASVFLLRAVGEGGLGSVYCTAAANSVSSAGSRISAIGSASLADADVTLNADNAPSQPAIFFFGPSQLSIPFGNGFRCVGGTVVRLPVVVGNGGNITYSIDFGTYGGDIASIGTANFQCWYRDPSGGGAAFNLSDAIEIVFTP